MTRIKTIGTLSIKRRFRQKIRGILLGGILALSAAVVPVQTIFAANLNYEWSRNSLIGASQHQWYDVATSLDGSKLVAVARDDVIYTSTDSGASWVRRDSSGIHNWSSVASSADGTKLVAVGDNGYIYTSTDSGATWTERQSAGWGYWSDVTSSADGTKLVAVQYDNYIYVSNDSGATWTPRAEGDGREWAMVASSANGNKLVAGDYDGYIYISDDSGETWAQNSDVVGRWSSLASSADGSTLIALSYGDTFYTSIDGGEWTAYAEGASYTLNKVTVSADGEYLAVAGRNSPMFISTNRSDTWLTRAPEAGYRDWQGLVYTADGARLIGTSGGVHIRISTDDAASWTDNTIKGIGDWQKIFASSDGSILVAHNSSEGIYRSTNGGASWVFYSHDDSVSLERLVMSADGTTLVGTDFDNGNIIHTSIDGGATWLDHSVSGSALAISANGTKIVVASAGGAMAISTNSGSTWTEYAAVLPDTPNSITASADGMTLIAENYNGHVYRSVNGGVTWSEMIVDAEVTSWLASTVSADGETMMVSSDDKLYLSNNGGDTWVAQESLPSYAWNTLALSANGQRLIAAAITEGIWVSDDAGVTWTQQEIGNASNRWVGVSTSANGSKIFAIEYAGYLYAGIAAGEEEAPPEQETSPVTENPLTGGPAPNASSSGTRTVITNQSSSASDAEPASGEVSVDVPVIDLMKVEVFKAGDEYTVDVKSGQVMKFEVGQSSHTMTINGVDGNAVTFTLRSTPQTHTLRTGETGKYDVDGDKSEDISVTVDSVFGDVAQLSITRLAASQPIQESVARDTAKNASEPAPILNPIVWLTAGGLLLILIGGIVIYRKTKRA